MSIKLNSSGGGSVTLQAPSTSANRAVTLPDGDFTLQEKVGQSMVRLNTANGYGSTNTAIRRFTNTVTNQGSDITYTDSATLGASFTINTAGVYAISYNDQFNAASHLAISLNTANPTTIVQSLPVGEVLSAATGAAANFAACAVWVGYLPATSVVRAHASAAPSGTVPTLCEFTITRVA